MKKKKKRSSFVKLLERKHKVSYIVLNVAATVAENISSKDTGRIINIEAISQKVRRAKATARNFSAEQCRVNLSMEVPVEEAA